MSLGTDRWRRSRKRIWYYLILNHISDISKYSVLYFFSHPTSSCFLILLKISHFQGCKVTCHQKCYKKADAKCSHEGPKPVVVATGTPPTRNRVFSVPLENLVKPGEKIPGVIDRLITSIELYGLYTEGLYRKSGAATKVGFCNCKGVAFGIDSDWLIDCFLALCSLLIIFYFLFFKFCQVSSWFISWKAITE